ncbi:C40 family peptidase [Carnobacteriaceae bacterium zg-ZUI78]|nr:C40 family peptidase [Carnobacteriaceae bacterium zg-ZUI78]
MKRTEKHVKKKETHLIGMGVVLLLMIFSIFIYLLMKQNQTQSVVQETDTNQVSNQWTAEKQLKVVNRFSTFLFKAPTSHPVKDILYEQALKKEPYVLNHEQRVQLLHDQLVDSELLYADTVRVLETSGDYTKVVALQQPNGKDVDGYIGWVFTQDLSDIPETFKRAEKQIVVSKATAKGRLENSDITLSIGSYLPLVDETETDFIVETLNGKATIQKSDAIVRGSMTSLEEMMTIGKSLIGTDYTWAGISGNGFDCSGLVHTLYRLLDIQVSRDTTKQVLDGIEIPKDKAALGDLLLFENEQGIHHVGIYVDKGIMLHAPNENASLEMMSISGTPYEKELKYVRRIVQP